jgi:hypothetical protein
VPTGVYLGLIQIIHNTIDVGVLYVDLNPSTDQFPDTTDVKNVLTVVTYYVTDNLTAVLVGVVCAWVN